MKFIKYSDFKKFIWCDYKAISCEIMDPINYYAPGVNWAQVNAPRFYRALQLIAPYCKEGATVVDIGSYPGTFPRLIKKSFSSDLKVIATGLTLQNDFKAQLEQEKIEFRISNIDPDIGMSSATASGLPFESETVDLVVCTEVIEHLYSAKTLITESYRILKKGGVLYLTTNNVADREGILRILRDGTTNLDCELEQTSIWSDHNNQWRGHVRFYSLSQLEEIGTKAGFRVVHSNYFQHYLEPDVIIRKHIGIIGAIRRWLLGNGNRPPIMIKKSILYFIFIGMRAFHKRFDNHLEIILEKN